METRKAERFKLDDANTERLRKSAIIHMQNLLNLNEQKTYLLQNIPFVNSEFQCMQILVITLYLCMHCITVLINLHLSQTKKRGNFRPGPSKGGGSWKSKKVPSFSLENFKIRGGGSFEIKKSQVAKYTIISLILLDFAKLSPSSNKTKLSLAVLALISSNPTPHTPTHPPTHPPGKVYLTSSRRLNSE